MTKKRNINLTDRELRGSLLSNDVKKKLNANLLGGSEKAERLRAETAKLREEHGLCPCSDETVFIRSEAMAKVLETKPNVICPSCLRPKLRVAAEFEGGIRDDDPADQELLAVIGEFGIPGDLLK